MNLNQGHIGKLLDKYSKVKVIKTKPTLFEIQPNMSLAFDDPRRCPYCTRKLKINLKRTLARCGRKDCLSPNKAGFLMRLHENH